MVPLVMGAMSAVYAASAYPFGMISDTLGHRGLLARSEEQRLAVGGGQIVGQGAGQAAAAGPGLEGDR